MKAKWAAPVPAVKLPMRHCDDCLYWRDDQVCRVGHYPRMYQPRHAEDRNYGYKRRCADFIPEAQRLLHRLLPTVVEGAEVTKETP